MAKYRKSIRGLVLTPEKKILLIQLQEPDTEFRFWVTPGGGIETGESHMECLCREIYEETGLESFEVGPFIWRRRHIYEWEGKPMASEEDFYLVWADEFIPRMHNNPAEVEVRAFRQFKWWTARELSQSNEDFAPSLIATYLQQLITTGPPEKPIDVGV